MIGTAVEIARWLSTQPRDMLFEAKPRKRKRTLTQNAYYWSMVNELSSALGITNDELHKEMLRSYGPSEDAYVRGDVPLAAYFKYFDVRRRVLLDGEPYDEVRVYKGSSEMDASEFARMLDGLRQECGQQDIPFMTPSELAALDFARGEQ